MHQYETPYIGSLPDDNVFDMNGYQQDIMNLESIQVMFDQREQHQPLSELHGAVQTTDERQRHAD